MKSSRQVAVLVLFVGVVSIVAFFMLRDRDDVSDVALSPNNNANAQQNATDAAQSSKDSVLPLKQGYMRYRNEVLGFSVDHPAELPVREKVEGSSLTVSLQGAAGENGFQIFAVPYGETTITKERFLYDVPSGVMLDQVDVMVDGSAGVAFYSENTVMGQTYEIWFIRNGYLYEVTTYKELDTWLQEIMGTWTFIKM